MEEWCIDHEHDGVILDGARVEIRILTNRRARRNRVLGRKPAAALRDHVRRAHSSWFERG